MELLTFSDYSVGQNSITPDWDFFCRGGAPDSTTLWSRVLVLSQWVRAAHRSMVAGSDDGGEPRAESGRDE